MLILIPPPIHADGRAGPTAPATAGADRQDRKDEICPATYVGVGVGVSVGATAILCWEGQDEVRSSSDQPRRVEPPEGERHRLNTAVG